MVVIIIFLFLLFQTPVLISTIIKTINVAIEYENKILRDIHDYMVIVVNMLMSFNSATNFLIYLVCGSDFRKTLKMLFCIARNLS